MSAHKQDVEKKQLLTENSLKKLGLYSKLIAPLTAPVKLHDLETLLKDEKFKETLTAERRLQLAINIIDTCISMHYTRQFMCTIDRKNILVEPETLNVKIIDIKNSFRANDSIAPEEYKDFKQFGCMPEPTEKGDIYFIAQCLLIPVLAGKKFCQHYYLENGGVYYVSYPVTAGENETLGKTITESFNIRKKMLVPLLNGLRAENPSERKLLEEARKELTAILTFVRQIDGKIRVTHSKDIFWTTTSVGDSIDQTHRPNTLHALSDWTI